MDIAPTVGPLTHDYCTDSRFGLNHETMGARLDLYKTYYTDPKPDSNPDTNPKFDPNLKPNPNSHPHFGIVVRSKSAMHRQTSMLFWQRLSSFSLPRSKFMRLSYKTDYAFVCCSNKCSAFCNLTNVLTDAPTLNTSSDSGNDGMRIPML